MRSNGTMLIRKRTISAFSDNMRASQIITAFQQSARELANA